MKFNKKLDVPTILANITVFLLAVFIFFCALLVPYLGFYGLLAFFQKINLQDLIHMNLFNSFFKNFFYVIGFLSFVIITVTLLELLFMVIKSRKIINLSSFLERFTAYIILVFLNFFMMMFLTDSIFVRIEVSNIFILLIFMVVYLYFFITGDVYKKKHNQR